MSYRTWYDPPRKGDEEPFPGSSDDMMDTIAALRARVAQLEAALREARPHILAGGVLMQIDAALKDTPQ